MSIDLATEREIIEISMPQLRALSKHNYRAIKRRIRVDNRESEKTEIILLGRMNKKMFLGCGTCNAFENIHASEYDINIQVDRLFKDVAFGSHAVCFMCNVAKGEIDCSGYWADVTIPAIEIPEYLDFFLCSLSRFANEKRLRAATMNLEPDNEMYKSYLAKNGFIEMFIHEGFLRMRKELI